jgi:hypothetical protein
LMASDTSTTVYCGEGADIGARMLAVAMIIFSPKL